MRPRIFCGDTRCDTNCWSVTGAAFHQILRRPALPWLWTFCEPGEQVLIFAAANSRSSEGLSISRDA